MSHSLYDSTIVMARGTLNSLERIITKAEAHQNADTFFTARIAEDMNPLTFQIHYVIYQSELVAATLSGQAYEETKENLDTYEKIHQRIREAIGKLDKVDEELAIKIGETTTHTNIHGTDIEVPTKSLVSLKYMPNVYFHGAMAYAILRKEGVPLLKSDWSRPFATESGYV